MILFTKSVIKNRNIDNFNVKFDGFILILATFFSTEPNTFLKSYNILFACRFEGLESIRINF